MRKSQKQQSTTGDVLLEKALKEMLNGMNISKSTILREFKQGFTDLQENTLKTRPLRDILDEL